MRAWNLKLEIRELSEVKLTAYEEATKITTELTGMPSASKDPHKFEKYASAEGNLGELLEKKNEIITEAVKAISLIENAKMRALLEARYLNGKKWDAISQSLGYPPITESDSVFHLHRKALEEIYKIIYVS